LPGISSLSVTRNRFGRDWFCEVSEESVLPSMVTSRPS
jgi:hypothetical protein